MISDYMRIRLADWPEMSTATTVLKGNKQIIMIGGREVTVSPFASDTEIEVALRLAFSRPKATMPETENGNGATDQPQTEGVPLATAQVDQSAGASASTPLPPPPTIAGAGDLAARPARRPLPTGSFVAGLRAMMDEATDGIRQAQLDGHAKVKDAVNKLTDAKVATVRVSSNVAQTISDQADDIMSELGQISNDL